MRGKPARDAEDAAFQETVAETIFAKRGYSRTDVYGVDRDTVTLTERYDLAATVRRVCAACGRRRAVAVVLGLSSVAWVVSAYTASYATGVTAFALTVAALSIHAVPDHVFERPGPKWSVGNVQSDGLSDYDVALRLAIFRERDEYREEMREKERKKAENNANTPSNSGAFGTNPRR